jgi:hypothetical protein
MKLVLENATKTRQIVKTMTSSAIQTFDIMDIDAVDKPASRLTIKSIVGTSNFTFMGNDAGSGSKEDVNFWHPNADNANNLYPAGDILQIYGSYGYRSDVRSILVGGDIKDGSYTTINGYDKKTIGYNKIWEQKVNCPDGYVALGDAIRSNTATKNNIPNDIKCVPLECVRTVPTTSVKNVWNGGNRPHRKIIDGALRARDYNLFRVDGSDNLYEFNDNPKCSINYI